VSGGLLRSGLDYVVVHRRRSCWIPIEPGSAGRRRVNRRHPVAGRGPIVVEERGRMPVERAAAGDAPEVDHAHLYEPVVDRCRRFAVGPVNKRGEGEPGVAEEWDAVGAQLFNSGERRAQPVPPFLDRPANARFGSR